MAFFPLYSARALLLKGGQLVCVFATSASMMFDIRVAIVGLVLIGFFHPMWVSMRLSVLAGRHALIHDPTPGPYQTEFARDIPFQTFKGLHNVFFFSQEQMRKELTRFAFVRLLLFMICVAISVLELLPDAAVLFRLLDGALVWPAVPESTARLLHEQLAAVFRNLPLSCFWGGGRSVHAVCLVPTPLSTVFRSVLLCVLTVFFTLRSRACFALWAQGRRNQWQVRGSSQDGVEASAAYVGWSVKRGVEYEPYIQALLTPCRLFKLPAVK